MFSRYSWPTQINYKQRFPDNNEKLKINKRKTNNG
jgi:hypothetical protein